MKVNYCKRPDEIGNTEWENEGEWTILSEEILGVIREINTKEIEENQDIGELSFFEDLGFDSIQLVDLIITLEEKYDIELSGVLEHMDCIKDFISYVEQVITRKEC